jgi:hypothetical protein
MSTCNTIPLRENKERECDGGESERHYILRERTEKSHQIILVYMSMTEKVKRWEVEFVLDYEQWK